MAANLVRFASPAGPRWGVVRGTGVVPLAGDYPTTAALIEYGESDWRNAQAAPIALDTLEFLSPVTTPCRIFCQGANYRQHMIESGLNPDAKTFNMFFTKSDASIAPQSALCGGRAHVSLLDYEIELALVFRRSIQSPVTVTRETLKDYVFAAAIANDISARDVQIPQMQFFKGKSYRGFCPIGPWLTVLEPQEFTLLDNLDLHLSRQWRRAAERHHGQSRLQTGRDDFGIVDLRQYCSRRRAVDRNAKRLRVAGTTAVVRKLAATAAGAQILAVVCGRAEPAAGISQARRCT